MFYVSTRRQPLPTVAFDRLFDGAFDRVFGAPDTADSQPARRPAVDVSEDDRQFVVVLDVPGVSREDVDVSVEGRRVSIVAEARSQDDGAQPAAAAADATGASASDAVAAPKAARALLRERATARYARSFTLPVEVDQAGAQARLENGVLSLTLPKRAPAVARVAVN